MCLYGPDTYRRQEELRALMSRYRERNPQTDLITADFGDEPEAYEGVCDFLRQPALFSAKKAAFIREGTAVSEKRWIRTLKDFRESEDVFVIMSDLKKPPKAFAFLLAPPVRNKAFAELEGGDLERFVKSAAARAGTLFEPGALHAFLLYLVAHPDRTLRAIREVEKLSLLTPRVTQAHLSETIDWEQEPEFYRAVGALLYEKKRERRLTLLEELFLRREDSAYVFNMLAVQARGAAAAALASYDVSKKSGGLEDEEVLLSFALQLG